MKKETKLGLIFAIFSNIFGGIQPVIANSRPIYLDAHIFSGMTALIQLIIFIPIFLIEGWFQKKKIKNLTIDLENAPKGKKLYFGQSKYYLFVIVGVMFSLVMFLYYSGLELAGSINGTLALKSTAFFGLLFGYLILKEKISKIQILFSCILFIGMAVAITEGAFYLLKLNLGVILILICSCIWMIGHTCSKPYLHHRITTSSELLIWRNIFTFIILIGLYLLIYGPYQMFTIIFEPLNIYFYIIGGLFYGVNVFCWYQIIKYLDVSISTILITPQIIITAFFSSIFLGENFTIFHLIGLIIILISIFFISKFKK